MPRTDWGGSHYPVAEVLLKDATTLQRFAQAYLETPELDVSPSERQGLAQAVKLAAQALGVFGGDEIGSSKH